jgi:hypothetical protein
MAIVLQVSGASVEAILVVVSLARYPHGGGSIPIVFVDVADPPV